MRSLVSLKIIGLSETFPTHGTPEGFLPRVYSLMSSEIRRSCKGHATCVANVRFLARVGTLVQMEDAFPHKRLPTLITTVPLLCVALFTYAVGDSSGVYFLVHLQVTRLSITFPAHHTVKRSLSGVY